MRNTKSYKRIMRIIIFIVLAAALLIGATLVLTPKDFSALAIYGEPRQSLDAVFVGSSHIMSAISPTQLWHNEHFTSYVMYSWSEPIWTSYYHLKHLLKSQSPKVAVVDALGCSYGQFSFMPAQVDAVSNEFSLGMPMSIDRLRLALTMMRCQETKMPFGTYVPLIKYHARWQYLTIEDFTQIFAPKSSSGKGYGPIYVHKEQMQPQYEDKGYVGTLNKYVEEYLYKLIKLCKDKNIKLVMMLSPHVFAEGEKEMYAQVNRICEENEIPFVNYNEQELITRTQFNFAEDMAEEEHVNYHGARKITRDMGEFLASEYALKDIKHTSEIESIWDKDLAIDARDEQNMDIRLETQPNLLAEKASEEGYVICVSTKGELNKAGKEAARAFFTQLGLSDKILDTSALQCAAIIENGKVVAENYGANANADAKCYDKSFSIATSFDKSSICIDGEEHSRDREGMNVVIYDKVSDKMIQSLSFNAFDNYNAFTA
ncbi:MAG: hypothetical protein RR424_02825 [Oscillospiraceae bacterium]